MEYASKATGDAGLTTGIIGTALGALNSGLFNGGLGGLFGGGNAAADLSGMAAGAALAAALGAGIAARTSPSAVMSWGLFRKTPFSRRSLTSTRSSLMSITASTARSER